MTDLRHEMVHVRVHQHLPFAPLWLDEGLAECFEERLGSRADVSRRELLRWRAQSQSGVFAAGAGAFAVGGGDGWRRLSRQLGVDFIPAG
jgi:hypothetical protein